jgi:hypothetical protein
VGETEDANSTVVDVSDKRQLKKVSQVLSYIRNSKDSSAVWGARSGHPGIPAN